MKVSTLTCKKGELNVVATPSLTTSPW